jgi:hypothetical protein
MADSSPEAGEVDPDAVAAIDAPLEGPVCHRTGDRVTDDRGRVDRGGDVAVEVRPAALGFLVTIMDQLTSVVIQGVPERFTDLVFEEAGLFYVPTLMYRLDQVCLRMPDEAPLPEKLPSEYMKDFYYGTQPMEVVPDESYYEYVIEILGGPE